MDCIVSEKIEKDWPIEYDRRWRYYIRQISQHRHQGFQRISRRGMAFTEYSDILPACNGMLCITLFLYITDYKIIIKHDRSFRPIFSGQEEHPSFSTNCITASCKTTVRFYLPLLPGRGQRAPANAINYR